MSAARYHERTLSGTLRKAAAQFPAVVVTGPRQSGKTTLVRRLFGDSHSYCSLDDPTIREQARTDPKLLLTRFKPPVILDEIQYAPEILHAVKLDIDAHRGSKGRYIITGSQAFPLLQGVTESLAGRAAILSLLSFSLRETLGQSDPDLEPLDLLTGPRRPPQGRPLPPDAVAALLLRGGFPDPAVDASLNTHLWYSSYVATYLERDVRNLRAIGDLADFQKLLHLLAARSGGLINFADLSRDLGVDGKTVKAWLSILESSGQVVTIHPYQANISKRLVKRPKVYFLDTGLAAHLLGVETADQLLQGMAAGALFETAVLGELHRLFSHRGRRPKIHFFKASVGSEVDFLIEDGSRFIPVEAKLTATPRPRDAGQIEDLQKTLGGRVGKGLVVCLCEERFPLTRAAEAVPITWI